MAWLHRPASHAAGDVGVLLCHSLGYEVMCSHRSYRYLATRLAATGIAALRFDYPSTGDSAGNVDDPDRVAAWLASIRQAALELKQRTGVRRLVLFGLRAGGTLAAAAAPGMDGLAAYVAWSPFASGSLILREQRALAALNAGVAAESNSIARADGGVHVAGFAMSVQTVNDLQNLSLTKITQAPAARCLLLARDDLPADSRLAKHWTALGSTVESVAVPGYPEMMRDAYESKLPLKAIETIVSWIEKLEPQGLGQIDDRLEHPRSEQASPSAGVVEQPEWFGSGASLSGVSARPSSGTVRTTAILFPTVGANHRIGSNRLHVELGRDLAKRGYLSLRFDIDGTGESGTVSERERFWEYKRETYKDLVSAIEWLKRQPGIEACILWGICSGAYMSYHAALSSSGVTGVMLFNLQLFRWRDEEVRENLARGQTKSFGFYARRIFRKETWRRLLTGDIDVQGILKGLAARIIKRVRASAGQFLAVDPTLESPVQQITALSRRGCRVSLVCTPEDTGLHEIQIHLGKDAGRVSHLPGVEFVEVAPDTGADHTFTGASAQHWLKAWTQAEILKHFP